jgi:hypothetical protein
MAIKIGGKTIAKLNRLFHHLIIKTTLRPQQMLAQQPISQ